MFWEFGIVSSEIEDILDKECESTLEKLLDEPDLLQEINSKNTRLIDYCSRDEIAIRIFTYTITDPDPSIEESNRYKYPMICSEILTAGIPSLDHVVLDDENYFMRLFDAFNQPSINILLCNFIVKIFVYFVSEYPERLYEFIMTHNIELVDILLKHIQYASICDAILKLQSHEISTDMRAIYIELLYEQNIIGKLYRMVTYDNTTEVKSAACNLFVEIIRIHRIRPTLFLDNFKYIENMTLVEQAQSNNLLQLLLDNMFAYTATSSTVDSNDDNCCEQWDTITKTINYGCIMLMCLFDSTRISDSYGDEFNEFGYIRNTILIVIATDFELLSKYIEKFVNHLLISIKSKVDESNSTLNKTSSTTTTISSSSKFYYSNSDSISSIAIPFGTTNINIVRLLTVLVIFQCEYIEKALIKTEFFTILWQYLPYFKRNNALHSLLFDCTSFVLFSDLYMKAPTYYSQNAFPKESVLAYLKTRYDLANSSHVGTSKNGKLNDSNPVDSTNGASGFGFGNSALLYKHFIHDIQILLVALSLHETCGYSVKCDFRGHLMQFVVRLSKLAPTTLIPKQPDPTIIPSMSNEFSNINDCPFADIIKKKWELFCNTVVAQFRKDNEIDPNVFSANTFHEDHLDSLFRSFDSNFSSSQNAQNDSCSNSINNNNGSNTAIISDADTMVLQANVNLEVEQGLGYMESVKQSLLFGADNAKFPSRFINGSKNAFICSSDDDAEDENCLDIATDKLPSFDIFKKAPSSSIQFSNVGNIGNGDKDEKLSAEIQRKIAVGCFERLNVDPSAKKPENKNKHHTTFASKSNLICRMKDPYDNSFEFGEKNNKYIESVMNDRVSTRLESKSGSDLFPSSDQAPNLSSNSISADFSSSSNFTLIDVDQIPTADVQQIADNVFSGKSDDLLTLNPNRHQPTSKSLSCFSDSDVFYSLPSFSDAAVSSDFDVIIDQAMTAKSKDSTSIQAQEFASLSDNILQNNSSTDQQTTTSSFDRENVESEQLTDRKGTSSPLKLSLSYNSEEIYDDDDDVSGVFCNTSRDISESQPNDTSLKSNDTDNNEQEPDKD